MKKSIVTAVVLLWVFTCRAQKFTLSGTIKSKAKGETVIGASIRTGNTGATSNEYGFYSLTLDKGNYRVEFSAVGLQDTTQEIVLDKDIRLNIFLEDEVKNLEAVVVSAQTKGRSISSPQMGVEKLSVKEIKNIPILLGERDILKTIQLLPGIKSAGEGNSGFYVRGGHSDQNLILLDEAPVYNASHLLGFFSTFNSDAIKD
ncbi:MAG TPA: carboxypeptidase-like regulatory domain-containing protein, partial [Chitinophagaceae bacterium]|nr:carboxypeptidase-like regulatory domain-containing protein [Chitinophagaceae bacterium]